MFQVCYSVNGKTVYARKYKTEEGANHGLTKMKAVAARHQEIQWDFWIRKVS